jgi:hypothetical protein
MSKDPNKKQLGNLASITAAIEATRTEIRGVQIQTGTKTSEAWVQVAIPLNQVNSLDQAQIEADHAEFVDNELRCELVIEIDSVGLNNPGISQPPSEDRPEAESSTDSDKERADRPETQSAQPPQNEGEMIRKNSGERTEPPATAAEPKSEPSSERKSEEIDNTDAQKDVPKYQDREQLAAVYDEDATFEEMRQRLDVEVTAQTVRKYMIKHGIHEPEPRPDRLLEAIRATEFELMNDREDRRPSQTGDSTNTDEHES